MRARSALLAALFSAVVILAGCAAPQGEALPQTPRAQVLRAYGAIEAAGATLADLERAKAVSPMRAGQVREELRRHFRDIETFDAVVRAGGAPTAADQSAFDAALRALILLRSQLGPEAK